MDKNTILKNLLIKKKNSSNKTQITIAETVNNPKPKSAVNLKETVKCLLKENLLL